MKPAINLNEVGVFNMLRLIPNSRPQPNPPVLLLFDLFNVDDVAIKKQRRYVDVRDRTSTSSFTSRDPHVSSSFAALVNAAPVVIIVISNVLHS